MLEYIILTKEAENRTKQSPMSSTRFRTAKNQQNLRNLISMMSFLLDENIIPSIPISLEGH